MYQCAAGRAPGLDVWGFCLCYLPRGFRFGRKSPSSCDAAPACAEFSAARALQVGMDFKKM